jgi:hypothetical protein
MENIAKLLGGTRQMAVVGASATPVPTGYAAFGVTVRVDATQIKSITEVKKKGVAAAANTGYTWESIALYQFEFIKFEFPVTSITLNAAGDSVFLHLEPFTV